MTDLSTDLARRLAKALGPGSLHPVGDSRVVFLWKGAATTVPVRVARREATAEAVARAYAGTSPEDAGARPSRSKSGPTFVIAARRAEPGVLEMVQRLGGLFVALEATPLGGGPPARRTQVAAGITEPRAWAVVVEALRSPPSVAELARRSGCAYSWALAVVMRMEQAGALRRDRGRVEVTDVPRLLDLAGFERPMARLQAALVVVPRAPLRETLRLISEAARRASDDVVVTGLAGATIALGTIESASPVLVYSETGEPLRRQLAFPRADEGTAVCLLGADRDVRSAAHRKGGVKVVAQGQLLLDLAGEGAAGRGAALEVVARLRRG